MVSTSNLYYILVDVSIRYWQLNFFVIITQYTDSIIAAHSLSESYFNIFKITQFVKNTYSYFKGFDLFTN